MKKLIKVLRYAIPYWGYASLNVLFNILSVLFSLASFALFIPILQMLFKTTQIPDSAPPLRLNSMESIKDNFYFEIGRLITVHGEAKVLVYIAVAIVLLYFFKNLFRYLGMFFLAPVRNGVVNDIRNEMYHKVLILPLSYFSEQRKGDIIARMTSDVQEIQWTIMTSLEMLFREPITIITFLVTLFIINPHLTLFVLILLPVSGYIIGQIGKSLKRTSEKSQKKMGDLLSIIEETIGGLRIIKAFNAIDSTNQNFIEHNSIYTRLMTRLFRKKDLASPLSEYLGALVLVTVLWFGGKIVLSPDSQFDAATFIVYLGIFSQLIPPAKALTTSVYNVQKGAASVERVEHILNAEEVILEKPDAKPVHKFESEIEFRNVNFTYNQANTSNGDTVVLKNIELKVPKGKTIALVGPSGAGKTTLINLLPRFYDVDSGEILLDGTPILDLVISDVRGLMGIVTQESILFNDTVFNNICLGKQDATLEEVQNAAKIANAHEFVMELDQGYETNIGDRGTKLSGGQQQRLSIARAILKNPPILLLDEATSSLDTESERLVQDALEKLMENRTSIVIAHRLSTIKNADEIIVLDKGKIVERGTHSELLRIKGVYKKLHTLQTFD
jgi:subfamily B ATP-binding cassette protein MsbA